jgi:hypothetical protein
MSVWWVIGFVAVLAGVLAAVAPGIDPDTDPNLAWLAHDFGPGDREGQASARRAAFRATAPVAVLAVVVTVAGLVLSGGAAWSGTTSFVGLVLVGTALLAGTVAGRRSIRRDRDRAVAR